MKIKLEEIKYKEISAHCRALNESGLLETPILLVGRTKDQIAEDFVAAVQAVPDDAETGMWKGPDEVADYYNRITEDEAPEKAEKKKKEPKEKAPAQPKKHGRVEVTTEIIAGLEGPIAYQDLVKKAGDAYDGTGGKHNDAEALWATKVVLKVMIALGLVKVEGDVVALTK